MKIEYFLRIIILFACLISFTESRASCLPSGSLATIYYSFGNVVAQSDAPVGTVLSTITASSPNTEYDTCTNGGYEYTRMSYPGAALTGVSGTYSTNIPGVGIKFQDGAYSIPATATYIQGNSKGFATAAYISLIKTGTISAGNLINGEMGNVFVDNGTVVIRHMLTGVNSVAVTSCTVNNMSLSFPIGNILISQFSSSAGFLPAGAQNTQTLGLTCSSGANINVTLSGTQNPDVSNTTVLALTGQGNPEVAKGVGVQIIYNNSPLVLNNRIVLKKSNGGQESFPITARYYQTKSSVATGTANATATLNITYQ
ncbi:fimbrial protein [Citrobacter sp. Marseille-Q6884]|uniref:fimbrial protein n=1 Tax=Citrobacter sp. Marseille-Q6884 TaxID=2956786 RepID=UPI0021B4B67B|nr:fimbrial protein [Citrobacter sp. Marseille-Q6884]